MEVNKFPLLCSMVLYSVSREYDSMKPIFKFTKSMAAALFPVRVHVHVARSNFYQEIDNEYKKYDQILELPFTCLSGGNRNSFISDKNHSAFSLILIYF